MATETEEARYQKILLDHKISPPPGEILKLRYITRMDDWYAQTPEGWFWWDGCQRAKGQWRGAPLGPL